MSLEVRTVTVCLFTHMHMCVREMDGHRERKRDCLSTVSSDGIRRTDMWRQTERDRLRERASDRVKEREREIGRASRPIVTLYNTRLGMCKLRPN